MLPPSGGSSRMERKTAADYPQELLNLFDLYVHGDIDRRGFLDGAKKFATAGMSATAIMGRASPQDRLANQDGVRHDRLATGEREYQRLFGPSGKRPRKAADGAGGT